MGSIALISAVALGCAEVVPKPEPVAGPSHRYTSLHLTGGDEALVSTSIDTPGRHSCTTVMVIKADNVQVDEQTLTALEGHFISRGLQVFTSAITGRVVASADSRGQIEGAAKLPTLERALVLAKGANAECVFYLLDLETVGTDLYRYFVSSASAGGFVEVDRAVYDAAPFDQKWFIGGPLWKIAGKVVDVNNGAVLSIVTLKHSTPFATNRRLQVEYLGNSLVPSNQYYGWRLSSPEDIDRIRTAMMARLALEVRGSTK